MNAIRTPLALILLLFGGRAAVAASPATRPAEADLDRCWADLAAAEPRASAALLTLSDTPPATVAFLKSRLKPLTLTSDELQDAIDALASKDDAVWKPAFEKLEYFDPRLAASLVDVMKQTTDPLARTRMTAVLCDYPADRLAGKVITLDRVGDDDAYNFRNGSGSWWAEARVSRLNATWWGTHKHTWTRAARAIALLKHIGMPEALAIVSDLATGDGDAMPTRVAKGEPIVDPLRPTP